MNNNSPVRFKRFHSTLKICVRFILRYLQAQRLQSDRSAHLPCRRVCKPAQAPKNARFTGFNTRESPVAPGQTVYWYFSVVLDRIFQQQISPLLYKASTPHQAWRVPQFYQRCLNVQNANHAPAGISRFMCSWLDCPGYPKLSNPACTAGMPSAWMPFYVRKCPKTALLLVCYSSSN